MYIFLNINSSVSGHSIYVGCVNAVFNISAVIYWGLRGEDSNTAARNRDGATVGDRPENGITRSGPADVCDGAAGHRTRGEAP